VPEHPWPQEGKLFAVAAVLIGLIRFDLGFDKVLIVGKERKRVVGEADLKSCRHWWDISLLVGGGGP
jgi:hypothetical protein